jgi:hypothetical protein
MKLKINLFFNEPKKDQSQLVLIFETRNPSHETEINPIEGKKEKEKIPIRKILMDKIEKKKEDAIKKDKKNNKKNGD